jgi:hypothetical protein
MKKTSLLFTVTGMLMASTLPSCKKSETATSGPSINKSQNTTMVADDDKKKKKDAEFTKDFIPLDGGDKADCTDAGSSCKVKSTGVSPEIANELAILETFMQTGNVHLYFQTPSWETLFEGVNYIPGLLQNIQSGSVRLYKLESVNTDGNTYVLSSATTQQSVSSQNTILAWQY